MSFHVCSRSSESTDAAGHVSPRCTYDRWTCQVRPRAEGLEGRTLLSTFANGDVFVAVANGQVQWYRANGTLVQTLNTGLGGFTTGMAFDSNHNLYVTGFSASQVSEFNNSGTLIGTFGLRLQHAQSIL